MGQEVKPIKIENLVLWTENPRDPIDASATDQDIVNKALMDKRSKWQLSKLAKEMGDYYDFSEIPTVVYHDDKPVVYDGNRRIILGKIKFGLVKADGSDKIKIPDFPEDIPCNVCSQEIALQNVYRKHADSGSWDPLERDIFRHKFLHKEKSLYLALDDETGIISANPHLNKRFVRDEILNRESLNRLGFSIRNNKLLSVHTKDEAIEIISDLSNKVKSKKISTRENRGKVFEVLDPSSQQIVDLNQNKQFKPSKIKFKYKTQSQKQKRQTRRVTTVKQEFFGGKLYLKIGEVSNLYRDIQDLYQFYIDNKNGLSDLFPSLIRMSLRLLCEAVATDEGKKMGDYIRANFKTAKNTLDKDIKTTLANQNVTEGSIEQLLHTGAHNYQSSNNVEQTIALSIIIGAMLTNTHGKN